jgi:hypothetical protein
MSAGAVVVAPALSDAPEIAALVGARVQAMLRQRLAAA